MQLIIHQHSSKTESCFNQTVQKQKLIENSDSDKTVCRLEKIKSLNTTLTTDSHLHGGSCCWILDLLTPTTSVEQSKLNPISTDTKVIKNMDTYLII